MKRTISFLFLILLTSTAFGGWDNTLPADNSAWNDAAGFIRNNWDALESAFGTDLDLSLVVLSGSPWYDIRAALPDGFVTDGSVDYSTEIQAAADTDPAVLFIPEGTWKCSITIDGRVNVIGTGPHSVLITAGSDPVITVTQRITRPIDAGTSPLGRRFENLTIYGNSLASKGIYYTVLTVEEEIVNVYFNSCTRAIDFGIFGAIANNVRYCSFRGCDYDIYAKDSGGAIKLNLNYFRDNVSIANKKSCIYLNGSVNGASGNEFQGNWFEDSEGFGIIIKGTEVKGQPNILASGWWEDIATDGSTVTLDDEGAGQVVRTVWLDTTAMISPEFPGNALVNDSILTIDSFRGDRGAAEYNEMSITGTSRVLINTATFDDLGSNEMIAADTASLIVAHPRASKSATTNRGFIVEGLPMINNVTAYTNQVPISGLATFSGSNLTWQNESFNGSPVRRFVLSDDTEWLSGNVTLTNDKVYVWTFSIKSSTTTAEEDIQVLITGVSTLLNQKDIIARGDRWTHFVAVLTAGPTAPTAQTLRIKPSSGNVAAFDITRMQFVEFDSLMEAEIYIHNQNFAVGSLKIHTLEDDATPSVISDETHSFWLTGGTTTITDFDDGFYGQVITVIAEHSLTITDGTNIFCPTGGNLSMAATDTLTLIQKTDGKWYTISYSDNT